MLTEPLTEEQEDLVLDEIGYSREQLERDLLDVKEWLKNQHHLPPSRLTEKDAFLTMFLTGCKGRLDVAKRKLDAYYTFRNHKFYECRDPLAEDYIDVKDRVNCLVIPAVSFDNGNVFRVSVTSLADPNLEKFDCLNYIRKLISFIELRLREDCVCARDFIIIDCAGTSFSHVFKIHPFFLRDLAHLTQEIFPYRYFKIVVINAPTILNLTVNRLIKPFLSKKLQERIILTSEGYEVLYEYLNKTNLPRDYGGTNPSLIELAASWHEKEADEREWFINELSERTDESKRNSNKDMTKQQHF